MRLLLALLLLLPACDGGPFGPDAEVDLARAEARWARRGFGDYAFETRQECFCAQDALEWARVEVRSGIVTSVVLVDDGTVIPPERHREWPTVESTFETIRRALRNDFYDEVVVRYDGALGHPIEAGFTTPPTIADGNLRRFIRAVSSLPQRDGGQGVVRS